jgi:hypothetical protein
MRVTTTSEQPQMRSKEHPYTTATLKALARPRTSAEQEQRDQELELLSLLVRVLNPQIRLKRVNDALRSIVEAGQQADLFPSTNGENSSQLSK